MIDWEKLIPEQETPKNYSPSFKVGNIYVINLVGNYVYKCVYEVINIEKHYRIDIKILAGVFGSHEIDRKRIIYFSSKSEVARCSLLKIKLLNQTRLELILESIRYNS